MKSPSRIHSPQGRAVLAATFALLFGAGGALAQTSASGSSTGSASSDKRDRTTSDTSTYGSGSSSSSSDRSKHSESSVSRPSQSGAAHAAAGNTLNTGAAADVDSTREINAQIGATTEAGAPTGRETSTNKLGWGDRRFVTKAADAGQMEIAAAKLATERATNSEVKSFAQKLVDDHTKVSEELKSIAGTKNVKLDQDDDHGRAFKRLSKKSGLEFDQEFVEHMIEQHESDVKLFEKAAKDAKDADIRSFASKHVDHLREHLRQAESLRATVVPTGRMDDNSGRSTRGADSSTSSTGSSDQSSSSDSNRGASTSGSSTSGYGSSSSATGTASGASSATGSSSSDTTNSSTTPKRDGSR